MATLKIREAAEGETLETATFVYKHIFMGIDHNYLCAVCREDPAVINCDTGVLEPCWACQRIGWEIRQKLPFWRRWFTK